MPRLGKEVDPNNLVRAEKAVDEFFNHFENYWLKETPYLAGSFFNFFFWIS